MIVCVDTNVFIGSFGRRARWRAIADALVDGVLELAVTTSILLEYEEIAQRLYGDAFREELSAFIGFADMAGQVIEVEPSFRFRTITGDPDDDAFADCAIIANASYIITEDRHFKAMLGLGYRPQPISPSEFIERILPTLLG